MEDNLSEDGLLNSLRIFAARIRTSGHKKWTNDDEQAYRQIAEVIGGYFRFLRETKLKPQVTEEWIANKARGLYRLQFPLSGRTKQNLYLSDCYSFIRSFVEEIQKKR